MALGTGRRRRIGILLGVTAALVAGGAVSVAALDRPATRSAAAVPVPTRSAATTTGPTTTTTTTPAAHGTTTTSTTGTPPRDGQLVARPLRPGERPPQFVVLSFDGAGSHRLWRHWLTVTRARDAHATFFLSGGYLVPQDRAAELYHPPRHPAGASEVGFATRSQIATRVGDLRTAWQDGHEVGTHFVGHFCGRTGVGAWSAADWRTELRQANGFLDSWRANTGLTRLRPLPFGSADVVGARTPCLEGERSALWAAERAGGFRYDASSPGRPAWPVRAGGLWQFDLPALPLGGRGRPVLAMDYNFYAVQAGARPAHPARRPAQRAQVLATYRSALDAAYRGSRAPLILGNHFETWNGGIYTDALTEFVRLACGRPGVRCVSFQELADWLDAQPLAVLARLQALPPVR